MAGVKGRSGGARPGAGAKRRDTVLVQRNRRDVVLDVITESEWRRTVTAWLQLAQDTPSILYPLLPYLLGAAKQEHDHAASGGFTIRIETVDDRDRGPDIRILPAAE